MASFARRRRDPPAPGPDPAGIEAFWRWWSGGFDAACAHAISRGTVTELAQEISARVAAVGPGLDWELAPGDPVAEHRLVVTAAGDPSLRAQARRWLRQAPAATPTWAYADSRGAGDPDLTLEVAGRALALAQVRVTATRRGSRLDVELSHPALAGLAENDRMRVAFLGLDVTLGETDVECWIGSIGTSLEAGPDASSLPGLRDAVARLKADSLDADGQPTWALLRGEGPQGPVVVLAQVPLSAAWAPQLDTHLAVRLVFAERTAEGFPADSSLAALRDLEDHLGRRLGASGRLVAHETSAGARTLHFYTDSTTPAPGVVEASVAGWSEGPVELSAEYDPDWAALRPFRG